MEVGACRLASPHLGDICDKGYCGLATKPEFKGAVP
jgi:hypothetical protein